MAEKTGLKLGKAKLRLGLQVKVILIVLVTVSTIMSALTIYELSPARNFGKASFGQKVDIVMARIKMPIVALIFASVLLVFLLSKFVIAPIQEASEASVVISSGDLTRRISYLSNDEMGDFVRSFNDMVESLLESRRSLERAIGKLDRRVKELSLLNRTGRALNSQLAMDDMVDLVFASLGEYVTADKFSLMLFEKDVGDLSVKGERGKLDAIGMDYEKKVAKKAFESRKPVIIGRLKISPEDGMVDFLSDEEFLGCLISVPLISRDEPIGVINLMSAEGRLTYDSDSLSFLLTFANQAAVAIQNLQLYNELERSYLNTVAALASAVDAKDPYTRGHSENVMRIAVELAKRLGLPENDINMIKYAGLLHDIGKISLPLSILHKREPLNEHEWEIVRKHPVIGSMIVENVSFLEDVVPAIRHHHENYDGSGYPDRLSGEDIPIMARILNIADALDTMMSRRPYKEPYPLEKVKEEIHRQSGRQFDPRIAETLLNMLRDGSLEAVIAANLERIKTEPLEGWEEI